MWPLFTCIISWKYQVAGRKEHRYECKLLQGKEKDDVTLRLLTKMILKSKNYELKKSNGTLCEFPSSYRDLCSFQLSTKAQEHLLSLFRCYEKGWRSKLRSHLSPFRSQEVLDTYQKLTINSFSMYDEMTRTIVGEALYIRASMFNHSCEPNCTFVFEGSRLSVRAIKRIEIGEECCISYMSSLLPSPLRREKLRSIYGFTCQCPRCLDSARDNLMLCVKCPNESCLDPVLPVQDGFFQICTTCHTEITSLEHSTAVSRVEAFSEEVLEEVKKNHRDTVEANSENDNRLAVILKQCLREQSTLLHPTHHCVMRIRLEAMGTFSCYGHWKEALEASQGVLEALRLHLSSEDPYIAFFLLKLSIIHYNLGDNTKTCEVLEQAIPLLETAYGDNHLVTQHAKDLQLKSS
ncbi:N-lysine methyltransferase SMYD2-B isoform X2 [Strongylocentrotus purpuratus]|uniref:SET domain-containing protein n=1 Tax=Strongylocentrotus purpuratus TaxID=7668 RepID=A0A7M7PLY8_STRPU|nr:N-lysine methyltransferase SMYD2-B isoform X2 [Strongylocentrotus purpuratus]